MIIKRIFTPYPERMQKGKQCHDQYIVVNVFHKSMAVELGIALIDR